LRRKRKPLCTTAADDGNNGASCTNRIIVSNGQRQQKRIINDHNDIEAERPSKSSPPLEYFHPDTVRCKCPSTDQNGSLSSRLAYLIIVHNKRTLDDAVNAFRALAASNAIIVIHIDRKLDWNVYLESALYDEVEICRCGAYVYVDQVHSCAWAEWSMNEPTLWAMDLLTTHTRFRHQWHVFMNLSGDTMPTRTPRVMSSLFEESGPGPLSGINFVTSYSCETGLHPTDMNIFNEEWHKRWAHSPEPEFYYYDDNGDEYHASVPTFFGSQWVVLTYEFVDYLASSLRNEYSLVSRYRDEIIRLERVMTDETFIPSILMYTQFRNTLPDMTEDGAMSAFPSLYAVRYERMDENMPSAFGWFPEEQRYEVPDSSIADQPKVWGPYFLGIYDLGNIKSSGCLFIRKVSKYVDPNIVNMFPVDSFDSLPNIIWPDEVQISPKPFWDWNIEEPEQINIEEGGSDEEPALVDVHR